MLKCKGTVIFTPYKELTSPEQRLVQCWSELAIGDRQPLHLLGGGRAPGKMLQDVIS